MIYYDNFDELDTSRAFCLGKLSNKNNNYVFPYINIGVSNHILNPKNEIMYINFSYLVFIDCVFVTDQENLTLGLSTNDFLSDKNGRSLDFIGGFHLSKNEEFEIGLRAKNCFIQIINDISKIRTAKFRPIEFNNKLPNMDLIDFEKYKYINNLPPNLIDLIN